MDCSDKHLAILTYFLAKMGQILLICLSTVRPDKNTHPLQIGCSLETKRREAWGISFGRMQSCSFEKSLEGGKQLQNLKILWLLTAVSDSQLVACFHNLFPITYCIKQAQLSCQRALKIVSDLYLFQVIPCLSTSLLQTLRNYFLVANMQRSELKGGKKSVAHSQQNTTSEPLQTSP